MSGPRLKSPEGKRLLREYILGTLSHGDKRRVEQYLKEKRRWRQALEVERERLGVLDALPDEEPRRDLTRVVMAAVAEEADDAAVRRPRRFGVPVLATGLCAVLLAAFIIVPMLSRARESASSAQGQNNLKQLGLVFKMYAGENDGWYPSMAPYDGIWMADLSLLYPEYLSDPTILVNPKLPDAKKLRKEAVRLVSEESIDWEALSRLAARSYTYSQWMFPEPEKAVQVARLYREADEWETLRARTALKVTLESDEALELPQLREGMERFLITDLNNLVSPETAAQSNTPVMFENLQEVARHRPSGANVLYFDGHVEFIRFGTKFPVNEETAEAFNPSPPRDSSN